MEITRQSTYSGIIRTLDMDVTDAQLEKYYHEGALLQDAFPHLSPADREFIKSGVTDEEWKEMFGFGDDEDEEDENEEE
jgi:hypothetical protein